MPADDRVNPDALGDDFGQRDTGEGRADDHVRPDRGTTDVVGARIGAQVVDVILQFVRLLAVALALAALAGPTATEGEVRAIALLALLTLPLYGGLLEGLWNGQTVGKRLVDVRVVDRDGRTPSVGQALVRNVPAVVLFSWATTAVALAAIATDDRRQRLFDRPLGTYVVDASPGPARDAADWRSAGSGGSGPSTGSRR